MNNNNNNKGNKMTDKEYTDKLLKNRTTITGFEIAMSIVLVVGLITIMAFMVDQGGGGGIEKIPLWTK